MRENEHRRTTEQSWSSLASKSKFTFGEGNGKPLQYSCLENPLDRGAWWAAVHGVAQSQTWLKRFSMHSCFGERNGNLLQYSCLKNPRDKGAWWAAVYGIAQSQTWLKRLSSSSVSFRWSLQTWVIALQISLGLLLNWHLTCTPSKPALKCMFSDLISSPVLIILSKGCSSGYFFVLIQKHGLICFNL